MSTTAQTLGCLTLAEPRGRRLRLPGPGVDLCTDRLSYFASMTIAASGAVEGAKAHAARVPMDPWGRWVRLLLPVAAGAAVLSLFFPWWAIRSMDGDRMTLWDGQWCVTTVQRFVGFPGRESCYPYSGAAASSSFPAGPASTLVLLEVLQLVTVVAFLLAAATYLLPRIRARARLVPAASALVGTVLAWVAVVDAWFAIPGGASQAFGATGITTFTGEFGAFYGTYGYAWGAEGAWFLLLLAGGLGILALLALRAGARSTRSSRSSSPRA